MTLTSARNQTIKPRARPFRDAWLVYGDGFLAKRRTLDEALAAWHDKIIRFQTV